MKEIPPSPPYERGGQENALKALLAKKANFLKAPLVKGGWGDLHAQLMKEEIPPSPPYERGGQEKSSKAPLAKGGWGDLHAS